MATGAHASGTGRLTPKRYPPPPPPPPPPPSAHITRVPPLRPATPPPPTPPHPGDTSTHRPPIPPPLPRRCHRARDRNRNVDAVPRPGIASAACAAVVAAPGAAPAAGE